MVEPLELQTDISVNVRNQCLESCSAVLRCNTVVKKEYMSKDIFVVKMYFVKFSYDSVFRGN